MIGPEEKSNIIASRRHMTAAVMEETTLDEDVLHRLVHRFYEKVRADPLLDPIFTARVLDWVRRLWRIVDAAHFSRWLDLFRETAQEVLTPAGAKHLIVRAERIARSLHIAVAVSHGRTG